MIILVSELNDVSAIIQTIACGAAGFLGGRSVNFLSMKTGKLITSIGAALVEAGKALENLDFMSSESVDTNVQKTIKDIPSSSPRIEVVEKTKSISSLFDSVIDSEDGD
jgi:hypothetical protein